MDSEFRRISSVYALWQRAGTPGERSAAAAAFERLTGERLDEPPVTVPRPRRVDLNDVTREVDAEAAEAAAAKAARRQEGDAARQERARNAARARAAAARRPRSDEVTLVDLDRLDAIERTAQAVRATGLRRRAQEAARARKA